MLFSYTCRSPRVISAFIINKINKTVRCIIPGSPRLSLFGLQLTLSLILEAGSRIHFFWHSLLDWLTPLSYGRQISIGTFQMQEQMTFNFTKISMHNSSTALSVRFKLSFGPWANRFLILGPFFNNYFLFWLRAVELDMGRVRPRVGSGWVVSGRVQL